MGKKKAIAGLTTGRHRQDDELSELSELSFTKEGKKAQPQMQEETLLQTSLTEQAKAGRNLVLVYLALAMLIAAMWDALHIELKFNLNAAVWVSLFNNGTIGSDHPLEEQPGLPGQG